MNTKSKISLRSIIILGFGFCLLTSCLDAAGALPAEKHYLSAEMKKAGYTTAVIGKWHLKNSPQNFDYYCVIPGQGRYYNPVMYTNKGGTRKKVRFDSTLEREVSVKEFEGHSSDVITDEVISWLETRDDSKPFFLMHQYKAPHDMFVYAKRYSDYLSDVEIPEPDNMYDEAMRMPLIVRYPQMIQAGSKSDWIINNTDFAPTMLALAGVNTPEYMQGQNFSRALEGKSEPVKWRKGTYYRYWMHMAHSHNNPAHFGIRTKRYKLIFFYGSDFTNIHGGKEVTKFNGNRYWVNTPVAWEFYDLEKDPGEMNNKYNDPEYQRTITSLKKQLKKLRKELDETDGNYPEIEKIIVERWDDQDAGLIQKIATLE